MLLNSTAEELVTPLASNETSALELLYLRRQMQAKNAPVVCDPTKYIKWKTLKYTGALANNPKFWRYQTQVTFVLTKGLALDLAVEACKNRLDLLSEFRSGRSGPVDVQHVYKAMCTAECLQNDAMHEDALTYTGCACTDLSTKMPDPKRDGESIMEFQKRTRNSSYHIPNDWCAENSARLLCDRLGFCGVWNCKVSDFMCPRYEWNKKNIPLKGKGSCAKHVLTGAGYRGAGAAGGWSTSLIIIMLSLLFLLGFPMRRASC